jgi:hypothetical protein
MPCQKLSDLRFNGLGQSARAPLRKISVSESVKTPGWASLTTLLSDTAYHSLIGEVEALNTTTIRRLTSSSRHQLLAIAPRRFGLAARFCGWQRGVDGIGERTPFLS